MIDRRAAITGALLALLPALLLTPALAAASGGYGSSRQVSKLTFTVPKPDSASGLRTHFDYANPDDPSQKPPAVRKVVETLARGARFDTAAPALCAASDAELMLFGASTCPQASEVGTGTITVDTGFPGPARIVTADVVFLNNRGEDIFVNTVHGTSARVIVRAQVRGRKRTTVASMLPGTPPDGGAIDTVDARDFLIRNGAHSYVTTPPRCPRRGYWTNRVAFTYADGVTQTVPSRSPCKEASR